MLGPVIEQLGSEMDGKAVVGKVDIDEQPELRDQHGIMSIQSSGRQPVRTKRMTNCCWAEKRNSPCCRSVRDHVDPDPDRF